ncbi:hypothetical protein [Actinophytocola sp.]
MMIGYPGMYKLGGGVHGAKLHVYGVAPDSRGSKPPPTPSRRPPT